ncbi:DEAD/DEAH box helicase [Streptococcus sp. DD12]|uniref:DEAD/DEAH box helicase n=1 Tax=Streptococcus sp. DD12 TaxID=1777880 RepID=UPI000792FC5A|nr:DEAD/DEAH box helicase [Streptococcus sp. DD12]KXT75546.1 SWF/SNF family helicase [Streptococcus sp. DD12]
MSLLMPGRVRNEGIALYEANQVADVMETSQGYEAQVEGQVVHYALNDQLTACTCELFAQKGYCPHIAALEYYFKQDDEGKHLLEEEKIQQEEAASLHPRLAFGTVFLNQVLSDATDRSYQLSVQGEYSSYEETILWSLYLTRLPNARPYVVRDVYSFLQTVAARDSYQIGKRYYEPLRLELFDRTSQDVLAFLSRLFLVDGTDRHQQPFLHNMGRRFSLPVTAFEEGLTLFEQLHGFVMHLPEKETRAIVIPLTAESGLFSFAVQVQDQSILMTMQEEKALVLYGGAYLFYKGNFYQVTQEQAQLIRQLRTLSLDEADRRSLYVSLDEQTRLAQLLVDLRTIGKVEAPDSFSSRDFKVTFAFDWQANDRLTLAVLYDYDGYMVRDAYTYANLPFASHLHHEQSINRLLKRHGFSQRFAQDKPLASPEALYQFFSQEVPDFERYGEVTLSENLINQRDITQLQLDVSTQANLLDISFDFSGVAEADVDLAMEALLNQEDYYLGNNGRLVVFDEETKALSKSLQVLRQGSQVKDGHMAVNALAAVQLADQLEASDAVRFSVDFERLAHDLRHPEDFPLPDLTVQATLRDYQKDGVRWLAMLESHGFGGILADDMGLGKTLQTISFLTSQIKTGERALILAPSSLVYNWRDEFAKFSPQTSVAVAYGPKKERLAVLKSSATVVITSYASFRQDAEDYQNEHFTYLILDEAQALKNAQTKTAHLLRDFASDHCFALSGTPIENHLSEIWSIFQIVLPGLLPSKKAFNNLTAEEVGRMIGPFVLRRRKEEVLPELPDLTEMVYTNELTEEQKTLYLAQLRQIQDRIRQLNDADMSQQRIEILSGITRLRQICDTPALFTDFKGASGKLESLDTLLEQLKENGHRVLLFSQFKGMLEAVGELMAKKGITSYQLTGSTPAHERQAMTKAYNMGSRDNFLISLKAGGVGLNLTGADTVILIDLWWNPAVEMQAISRAHRLGQKQKVDVYRLITRGTIEERILELQEGKRELASLVLDTNNQRGGLTNEDIRHILGLD